MADGLVDGRHIRVDRRFLTLLLIVSVTSATRDNIARGKTARQSNTYSINNLDWTADFAVNGIRRYLGDHSTSCSGTATTPGWWELDLGQLYDIGRVDVYGRKDRPDQTWGFKLYVSETPNATANGEEVYFNNVTQEEFKENDAHFIIPLDETNVRYVSMYLPWYSGMAEPPSWYVKNPTRTGSPPLVICEVEVYPSCAQYQFEPDCTTCHCDGPPCDRKTGSCPSGICLPGWTGPSCSQGENIALQKPASASSYFHMNPDWETSHVVDGDNSTDNRVCKCCTATNGGRQIKWIQVDLEQQFLIDRIMIYGRTDTDKHEFGGLEIKLSNDSTNYFLLYTEPNAKAININYLLTSPHVARYVRLHQSDARTLPFTVCELQVFPRECGNGTFGEICGNRCFCSGQSCNIINGHCPSGKCLPGYHLDNCSQPCPEYYYGNCTSRCGQCRNAASCDRVTGECPDGGLCEPGYTLGTCQEVCRHGRYGEDCQTPCGKCRQNATCHHINGTCQNGCAPGYRGINCTQECMSGTFGDGCNGICRCLDKRICNIETGYCPGGQCAAGYRGFSCEEECQDGTFGLNCNKTCGQCKDEPCNHKTGDCKHGCDPGYQGNGCSDVCTHGNYGPNCQEVCGSCKNNASCHHVNGNCSNGCAHGYHGDKCIKICNAGNYGKNCQKTCGACKDNASCHHVKGRCSNGCEPGYQRKKCIKPCLAGNYGTNCRERCGSCKNNDSCHHVNGNCNNGCDPGYQGDGCTKLCTAGNYGADCQEVCGACKHNVSCHHVNGNCSNGCEPGYQGDGCTKPCTAGYYGPDCQERCGYCKNNVSCHHVNGSCSNGCDPGYQGDRCTETCTAGNYGANCQERCGACNGTASCHNVNGNCNNGCDSGYQGDRCVESCTEGYYGPNCQQRCGSCKNNTSCHHVNGNCNNGCEPGYQGDGCTKPCTAGNYGTNCRERCGSCQNNTSCHHVNGSCRKGCDPGYQGDGCVEPCTVGNYGTNCRERCGYCKDNDSCHHVNGSCSNGCDPGYQGDGCITPCTAGYYGTNCQRRCGSCKDNASCHHVNGNCSNGCEPGYQGNGCTKPCTAGNYGADCRDVCGACRHNASCHHVNGTCSNECQPGYEGKGCNKTCTAGNYGTNCQELCGSCKDGAACHHVNGNCNNGCAPGYQGDECTGKCENGTYGDNCQKTCGSCKNKVPCHHRTGNCTDGCNPEFQGHGCFAKVVGTTPVPGSDTNVAAIVVPLLLLMILIPVVVFFVWRRKRGQKGDSDSKPATVGGFTEMQTHDKTHAGHTNRALDHDHLHSNGTVPQAISTIPDENDYYGFGEQVNALRVHHLWSYIRTKMENECQQFFDEFASMGRGLKHPHDVALLPENRPKNRYRDMYAYDHSRVPLTVRNDGESEYINACFIDGYERVHKFIASQGPTKVMIDDFWRMIWQQKSRTIVMLTNLVEQGTQKCLQYWPDSGTQIFEHISVELKTEKTFTDYTVRQLKIQQDDESPQLVTQYHFRSWPDKDVPDDAWSLVNFWRHVMGDSTSGRDEKVAPIIVHCSAGIGRTGTFVALDNLFQQAQSEGCVRPLQMVETLRRQRVNMVQTKEQYVYLHEAMAEALLFGTHFVWTKQFEDVHQFMKEIDRKTSTSRIESQYQIIEQYWSENEPEETKEDNSEYINISIEPGLGPSLYSIETHYVPGCNGQNDFIVTSSPTKHTLDKFLSEVEKNDVSCIVMLTDESSADYELARGAGFSLLASHAAVDTPRAESLVCCCLRSNDSKPTNKLSVNLSEETRNDSYVEKTFTLKHAGNKSTSTLTQLEFTSWPKNMVTPSNTKYMLRLIEAVQNCQKGKSTPVLIHCGDGHSRSGLVCVLLNEMNRITSHKGHINIVESVMSMRGAGVKVITSEVQYRYCYDVILAHLTQSDVYENV